MRARGLDISQSGVCIFVPEQLRPGQACVITLETTVNGKPSPLVASAKVIYSTLSGTDGFRTGMQFVQLDAENSKILAALIA